MSRNATRGCDVARRSDVTFPYPVSGHTDCVEQRAARLEGGPADGQRRTVSVDEHGSSPERIRSEPTGGGKHPDESYVYELTSTASSEGDLVYRFVGGTDVDE